MSLNRRLYYLIQKRADTPKQKINASEASRVLKALREVLKEKAASEDLASVFELIADLLKDSKGRGK